MHKSKIVKEDHESFNENVIKNLAKNHITSIYGFLQEDVEKLAIVSKLDIPHILSIRNDLFAKFSAPLINGSMLFEKHLNSTQAMKTDIKRLDAVLNGGIPIGFITEICGLADSGKTQLCFQIAINVARNTEGSILYIDTKCDFSAVRIQKILAACGCSNEEMVSIMCKIKIVHLWTMEEIIDLLKSIKDKYNVNTENWSLIIVDSLCTLMFQYLGDNNKIGLSHLNSLVNYCRFLAKECRICIICVNIETRWLDRDIVDVEDDDQSATNQMTEKRNRCLGKYWHYIPALILRLEKVEDSFDTVNNLHQCLINITILSSVIGKRNDKCVLTLNHSGVT